MIQEPFCPLYREARDAAPWKSAQSAHAGLLFDKFADAWRYKRDHRGNRVVPTELEFDKGGQKKVGANDWINGFRRAVGDPRLLSEACAVDASSLLSEACQRQRDLIERMGGKTLLLTNTDRFVTGMGREHPLENGFAWHHTLGVPYLPASSVKGMLRAWLRETEGAVGKDKHGNEVIQETDNIRLLFGKQGEAGRVLLFDMLPREPPSLEVDVMTPHYGPYYQGDEIPGDWHSPVPITFLTVAAGQSWQLGITRADRKHALEHSQLDALTSALFEAFEVAGAGAKTAVGYGRFVRDKEREQQLEAERAKREAEARRAAEAAAEKARQEAEDAKLPADVRTIVQLERTERWFESQNPNPFLDGIEAYLRGNPNPSPALVIWLKEHVFESARDPFTSWKGHWADPEKQNKKGKYKLKSKRARAVILQLKECENQ